MNYAVLPYKYVKYKPAGMPDAYPAEVRGLGESTVLPPGEGWQLMTGAQLTALKAMYQEAFNRVRNPTVVDTVAAKVGVAAAFGRNLISRYAAQNVLAGYNVEQIKTIIDRTAKVIVALNSGSLYIALDELATIPDDALTPASRITEARHEIQDYLGIPRT